MPLHVIGVQRAAPIRPDFSHERRLVIAQPIGTQLGAIVDGAKVAILERATATLRHARVAARAVGRKHFSPTSDCTLTELPVEIIDKILIAIRHLRVLLPRFVFTRDLQISGVGFRRAQEVEDVGQAILDRTEVRAVTPALTNVEWRLAEVALLRIKLTQIRQVVDPTRFSAGSDVEVHALYRLERADGILAAL